MKLKQTDFSFAAPAAGLLTALCIILLTSRYPLSAAAAFFTAPFGSIYYFGSWLNTASFLIIAGTGAAFAVQSGNMNLGGEGQIYAGGFAAAATMNVLLPANSVQSVQSMQNAAFAEPSAMSIALVSCAALAASVTVSAAAAFIPAVLKLKRGISELISSFLLSAAVIPLIDYAVSGPLRDQSKNLLALPLIHGSLRFKPLLEPSPLNMSVFFVVPAVLCSALFLYKTRSGQRFRICGSAPEFALYCAYPVRTVSAAGMAVSGALHGLAGYAAVAGTYYTCHSGFYAGMGWNALSAALIARSNPLLLVPVSLFLAYIFTGTSSPSVAAQTSYDLAFLVQAAVMLFISASFIPKAAKREKAI